MGLPRTRSLRDVVLILLGATSMHLASNLLGLFPDHLSGSIIVNTQVSSHIVEELNRSAVAPFERDEHRESSERIDQKQFEASDPAVIDLAYEFPETTILSHAPGWTLFRNLYMSNGTLYIVSSQPPSSFPDTQYMTSTGLPAENTPENIAARMPTSENMDFISPAQARGLWGGDRDRSTRNRVWSVGGNTFLVNEPQQFLDHYYHFCAELMFGAWSFWSGAFNAVVDPSSAAVTTAPPVHRMIFTHAAASGWRDKPGFNSYFLRAAFPSLTVEVEDDWEDRIHATSSGGEYARAWHFDTVLLTDRSAAFRGEVCGAQTQRIASEAFEHMRRAGNLTKWWWEPLRRGVLRFAGVDEQMMDVGVRADAVASPKLKVPADWAAAAHSPKAQDIVVTYISRQGTRRHLIDSDHEALVNALTAMCASHRWELNIVQAERLSKEEQLALAARTTVMVGVHGNGLTHLIMMPVTPVSTVIEIFYPGGFAHDYEWTTRAMGMRHFAIWNDTYHSYPEMLWPSYPEGFQGTQIPVYPPAVTQIIEDRIAGRLP
ncbi:hypothetical protein AcV5_007227 [Taiwanofungus camphoratus]|nr:hypothetical protein AcV5_007227 [Antrodia cinnamomea]